MTFAEQAIARVAASAEGRDSWRMGRPLITNPYRDWPLYGAWREGWLKAQRDAEPLVESHDGSDYADMEKWYTQQEAHR